MVARSIPKTAPRRQRLLYVGSDAESLALAAQLIAGRRDLVLLDAADLDAALELARRERPEVVLVDLDPAALPAAHVIKRLRDDPALQSAPVLALSADPPPGVIVKCLEAGFFQYLTKPLQPGPFTEALAYALEFVALERAEL